MKPSVEAVFPSFTARFEGRLFHLYLDVRGLVTTGVGILVDPIAYALALDWRNPDGSKSSQGQIADAWHTVKAATSWAPRGGVAFAPLTEIRLTPNGVDALTLAKLRANDVELSRRVRGWETLPAPAQLATHSLAWACGPDFDFPKFLAALESHDWATCATECQMDATDNPGLVPRNRADYELFALAVHGDDLGPWAVAPSDETTEPEIASLPALAAEATDGLLDPDATLAP